MPLITIRASGIESRRLRLHALRAELATVFTGAIVAAGETARAALADAAPHGTGNSAPEGDASGSLASSFQTRSTVTGTRATVTVYTTQPRKLRYVRYGTGVYGPSGQRIRPRTRRALMWPGAQHPVRSVRGMRPNDFVTPALEVVTEQVIADIQDAIREAIEGV